MADSKREKAWNYSRLTSAAKPYLIWEIGEGRESDLEEIIGD